MDPNGIYLGDGEWLSWSDFGEEPEFSSELERLEWEAEKRLRFPHADPYDLRDFDRLVALAQDYLRRTGRHLDVYGQIGELFAATRAGVKLHRNSKAPGSDGRSGNDWVEVKTIGPASKAERTKVDLSGNFNRLMVVRIQEIGGGSALEGFRIQGRIIDRKSLTRQTKGCSNIAWSRACEIGEAVDV